jgi:hypothetical protein
VLYLLERGARAVTLVVERPQRREGVECLQLGDCATAHAHAHAHAHGPPTPTPTPTPTGSRLQMRRAPYTACFSAAKPRPAAARRRAAAAGAQRAGARRVGGARPCRRRRVRARHGAARAAGAAVHVAGGADAAGRVVAGRIAGGARARAAAAGPAPAPPPLPPPTQAPRQARVDPDSLDTVVPTRASHRGFVPVQRDPVRWKAARCTKRLAHAGAERRPQRRAPGSHVRGTPRQGTASRLQEAVV